MMSHTQASAQMAVTVPPGRASKRLTIVGWLISILETQTSSVEGVPLEVKLFGQGETGLWVVAVMQLCSLFLGPHCPFVGILCSQ